MTEEAPRMSKSAQTRVNNFTRILTFLRDNPGEHTASEICRVLNLRSNSQIGTYCSRMPNVIRIRREYTPGYTAYKYIRWTHWIDVTIASKNENIELLKDKARADKCTVDDYVKKAVNAYSGVVIFPEVNDAEH